MNKVENPLPGVLPAIIYTRTFYIIYYVYISLANKNCCFVVCVVIVMCLVRRLLKRLVDSLLLLQTATLASNADTKPILQADDSSSGNMQLVLSSFCDSSKH